jgi:polysaccharide export outer membrane protein
MIFKPVPAFAESGTSPYLIGPSDVLNIHVWKEPELTRDVMVMLDGSITYPLIGEVHVQDKTVTELKNLITEKLEDYVEAPEVTVIVNSSGSKRIYLIGKINGPGPMHLDTRLTVIQALASAGGLAEWADEKNIQIIRRVGDKETRILFNYKEFVSGENIEQNIILQPGDTIVVP